MKLGSNTEDTPEINLIPLIDVLFCLILFLVLTTSFNQRNAMKLQLPQAQAETVPDTGSPLIIVVDADGHYYVGNNEVLKSDVESVKDAIRRAAGDERSQSVILRADGRTPHQFVVTAMDALGQLGFSHLAIATTPAQKKQQ
jgi:biopolymer transport protein ExbD